MNKRQNGNYSMFRTVELHFQEHPLVWRNFAPIATCLDTFSAKLTLLAALITAQMIDLTGITQNKDNLRKALELQMFKLSGKICAYAGAINDDNLYNSCHNNTSTIQHYTDDGIVGACTYLLAKAQSLLVTLEPYGITEDVLDDMTSTMRDYVAIMKKPKESLGHRSTTTDNIEVSINDILLLLTKQMDNLVVMLMDTAPDFVETYKTLRITHPAGTRHWALTITTLDATTNLPIPNVDIEVVGKNIKRVSSARGFNVVQSLVGGAYEIKATQENYVTKIQPFTIVSGETTELVVLLEAK